MPLYSPVKHDSKQSEITVFEVEEEYM